MRRGGCFKTMPGDDFPMRIPLDDGGGPIFLDAKNEG